MKRMDDTIQPSQSRKVYSDSDGKEENHRSLELIYHLYRSSVQFVT